MGTSSESSSPKFKVTSWPYSLKGSGFCIVCRRSGLSLPTWYPTVEAAEQELDNPARYEECACRYCTDYIFEKEVLK